MLSSLTIQDFVIVDSLHLDFDAGMSVLSGETGAGKSILIDALSLCLGARAEASQVREGKDKAIITAVFEPSETTRAMLAEQGLETEEDELHLRRVIEASGRSKAFVNGSPVPAGTLKALAETLIDIHGQHAFQTLAKPAEQLRMVDEFGQHQELLNRVKSAYQTLSKAQSYIKRAEEDAESSALRLQTLQWQFETLDKIKPQAGQWETLSQEHDRLSHSAELMEGTHSAHQLLSDGDQSLMQGLTHIISSLTQLSKMDGSLENIVKTLSEGEIQLREAAYDLGHYVNNSSLDPESLAIVETRLSDWMDAARKLRIAPEELAATYDQLKSELQTFQEENSLESLQQALRDAQAIYQRSASNLSEARKKAAAQLAKQVTQSMQALNMQGGLLNIELSEGSPSSSGSDQIEFLVAGHPGVTPQPIQKVASGGELARISLAITVNTVESAPVPTLIFDEVDSGIGGAVAETVGKYLRQLGSDKQVLCVTHLPQVAAQGHHHFRVSKAIETGETRSTIEQLGAEERVMEIARMLGGQVITEATKTAAREMIAS